MDELRADTAPAPAPPPGGLFAWIGEGARPLVFKSPRWPRLHATPLRLALLVLLEMALTVGFHRLYIDGPAEFQWESATAGWTGTLLLAWACYLMRPAPACSDAERPGAADLFTLLMAQSLCLTLIVGPCYAVLLRSGMLDKAGVWAHWVAWIVPVVWSTLAIIFVLLRAGGRRALLRQAGAMCAVGLAIALTYFIARPPAFWHDAGADTEDVQTTSFRLTQDIIEAQTPVLEEQLDALKPQRPGVADMYTITFAPYEGQEVFRRESAMVSEVMAKRFDAAGRGLQLINHQETAATHAWATPLNLQRAIQGIADTMDRNEDVLFIHLTSHGASDGELAATFLPLEIDPVMPPDLKRWLDEAGIRHRVISISACYAGNWIAPLANEHTLVMTASDADNTSYGCGTKSDLTFFGRAMYDEQLRSKTLSFEEAHAAARKVILQRETEAGKTDGYSNPQIKIGSAIGPYLKRLRERLGADKTSK